MQHAKDTASSFGPLNLKAAGREGEQVRRQWLGLGKPNRGAISVYLSLELGAIGRDLPRGRDAKIQAEPGLEVGLIETRKGEVGTSRHEE
jgi:hypothetical protein